MNMKKKSLATILAFGVLGIATADASAAEAFVWVGSGINSTGYAFSIYEYRYDIAQQKSLKCASTRWDSAPIVVSFGGADGTLTDMLDSTLGRKLSNACVRLVGIKGANAYMVGAPPVTPFNTKIAWDRVSVAGQNMGYAVNAVINWTRYSGSSHVTVKGGSASGIFGAKVLEQRFAWFNVAPWNKVRRFVFGGPPAADLAAACRNTAEGAAITLQSVTKGFTGYESCRSYLVGRNYQADILVSKFTPTQLSQLYSMGMKINTFVGDKDDIFGYGFPGANCATAISGTCWKGPDGVDNYLYESGLYYIPGGVWKASVSNPWAAKFASASAATTFTTIPGATHSSGPDITSGICDVIAEGRANTNPAACYDPGTVVGVIDSVQSNTVSGWACASRSPYPIAVHLYVGGSAGAGTVIGGYTANAASELAVASVCGSFGRAYRFQIPLSLATRQAHVGKKIYIHAIQPTGTSPNYLINNSGVFSVPAP
ncbi:MAG: hypothetical protein ABL934_10280 [Lysobacteraceae bacterium]